MNRATRIVASAIGGVTSAAGVLHGYFEILQGNAAPDSLIINAIGPGQRSWEYAALHAFTVVPDFLITGILAVIFGVLASLWAIAFIDKRYGPWGMFLLSIVLFLVGGGSGPLFVGTLASLLATVIHKPLAWWRTRLSPEVRSFLVRLWPGILIIWAVLFVLAVETTLFGWPLTLLFDVDTTYIIVATSGQVMLLIVLLSILSAFAHDIGVTENH